MATWTVKQNDYHRQLGIDLTELSTAGASSVSFRLRPAAGGTTVATVGVIASSSRVTCQFASPTLATPGTYFLEVVLTFADGTETAPTSGYVTVVVEPRLS